MRITHMRQMTYPRPVLLFRSCAGPNTEAVNCGDSLINLETTLSLQKSLLRLSPIRYKGKACMRVRIKSSNVVARGHSSCGSFDSFSHHYSRCRCQDSIMLRPRTGGLTTTSRHSSDPDAPSGMHTTPPVSTSNASAPTASLIWPVDSSEADGVLCSSPSQAQETNSSAADYSSWDQQVSPVL